MTPEMTYLLIGLGNPGREYRDNRHNVGFMLIDQLIVRLNARGMKVQSKAIVTSATYEERKLILAKPQTYMKSFRSVCTGIAQLLQDTDGKHVDRAR